MKILVTGTPGFVSKNLIPTLRALGHEVLCFGRADSLDLLDQYTKDCEFVYHLAAENRPKDPELFRSVNAGFTNVLCEYLRKNNNVSPIVFSSSIQVSEDNLYGKSKLEAEEILKSHAHENQSKIIIYRLSNLYGKWSRPNYNSVIATWSHNISRNIAIQIDNPDKVINLCYIDDVIAAFVTNLREEHQAESVSYPEVSPVQNVRLGDIADLLEQFKTSRETLTVCDMSNYFAKTLYSTYLNYIPTDAFSYPLKMNKDERGSFTEMLRLDNRGQVSVNVSKPGITKGNHWHHSKNEKFLVVKGEGLIQFRDVFSDHIIDYRVSGSDLRVVDIPTGYTHNIINVGEDEMVTVMWVNEPFDPENPDTFYEEV